MKKMKRILALIGVIMLLTIYALTFVGALISSPYKSALFLASIYSTFVIPILLYAYMLVYRNVKKDSKDDNFPPVE